ncbi:MAG TPA: pre-peptidase C-terminal domain-containing protein [Roseiflexaceae bacterium]|nr:pre-peptidase C-terminal domain-containing protein [Roseiflexaceae bacterium]
MPITLALLLLTSACAPSRSASPTTPAAAPVAGGPTPTVVLASDEVSRQARPGALHQGQTLTGQLSETSGLLNDGSLYDSYAFDVQPGQFVELDLRSAAFDAFLVLVNQQGHVVASNDDYDPKASTDARLALPLPPGSGYQVWVNSSGEGTGDYTLRFAAEQRGEQGELRLGDSVEGWLMPGETPDARGIPVDTWTVAMPDEPAVVWLSTDVFDPDLHALLPDGSPLIRNDDVNFVAGDGSARIVLAPSDKAPAGTPITLNITMPGARAGDGGAYRLRALPLPQDTEPEATVRLRPLIIRGEGDVGGSAVTEAQVRAAIERADAIWSGCGIRIALAEGAAVERVAIEALKDQIKAGERTWTADETLLQRHRSRPAFTEREITVYFAKRIDGGERYGIAYPSTRYPASRSGLVVISDDALAPEDRFGTTLAHEIGHILGLEHPNSINGDGDPWNDTAANLMGERAEGAELDPIQCATARGAAHYLHAVHDAPLVPEAFRRSERVLLPGSEVRAALTPRNNTLPDGQYVEVYYLTGTKGDRVELTLESDVFDPVLTLDGPDDQRIALDDDSGGGRTARLSLTLPETGDYSIGVTSYMPAVGGYRLMVGD